MAFVEEPVGPESEGAAPEGAQSRRTFIIAAAALGGLFVIGLVCLGLYAFVIGPQQRAAALTQAAAINATNQVILAQNTQLAQAQTQEAAATATPPPTATAAPATPTPVVAATDTATVPPPPTNTPAPTDTSPPPAGATVSPTPSGGPGTLRAPTAGGPTATPTRIGAATSTPLVGGLRTPTPTQLPGTGFADEAGVPQLILLGLALVAVVVVARRLRLSLR